MICVCVLTQTHFKNILIAECNVSDSAPLELVNRIRVTHRLDLLRVKNF